jgi:hypothetical protein
MSSNGLQVVIRHLVEVGNWANAADSDTSLVAKHAKATENAHIDAFAKE